MTNSKTVKKGYEAIGRKGYTFRVGFLSWTIAKIWQRRNATSPALTDEEKRQVAEKFDKPIKVVEQAIIDNWPRYWRGGKKVHILRRSAKHVTLGDST